MAQAWGSLPPDKRQPPQGAQESGIFSRRSFARYAGRSVGAAGRGRVAGSLAMIHAMGFRAITQVIHCFDRLVAVILLSVMGLGFVLLIWAIVGTVVAGIGAMVLGYATALFTRGATGGRRRAIVAASLFPFACLAGCGKSTLRGHPELAPHLRKRGICFVLNSRCFASLDPSEMVQF